MDAQEKVREARLRRVLARRGYALSRSRRRDPGAMDYGRYSITPLGVCDVVIEVPGLDGVEQWIARHDRQRSQAAYRDVLAEVSWQQDDPPGGQG